MKNFLIVITELRPARSHISDELKRLGFAVLLATNENEIIEKIKLVDTLIIDPFIPRGILNNHNSVRMDGGYEVGVYLIKECLKVNPSIKVIVYSTLSREDLINAGLPQSIIDIRMPETIECIFKKIGIK
jgi:hypothetical protein